MPSDRMTVYRKSNPEYYEKEKIKLNERYKSNPEYKERTKQLALARYYRLKEEKQKLNGFIDD